MNSMLLTSHMCLDKYGNPYSEASMVLFDVPTRLELGAIPKKIYCNRDMVVPLTRALENVINRDLITQIKTWDGCFHIRRTTGGSSYSLHSWGAAIDINASWNRYKAKPTMSHELVQCFKDAGFDWGGDFSTPDGMHFQLKEFN